MNRIAVALLLIAAAASARADSPPPSVVAIVNGEPITSLDLDAVVMGLHQTADMRREALDDQEILDRAIHDRLLLQEAAAMGLVEDPVVLAPVEKRREEAAIRSYARATFTFDDHIDDETVREYFETYYRKIRVEQLSTRTAAELDALVPLLEAGASWDSLARIHSTDSHQYRGGRHNLKLWLDVENSIRDASLNVPIGVVSEPFDYHDKVSVIRVEERYPADEATLASVEDGIRAYFQSEKRKEAWGEFVGEHLRRTPVTLVPEVEARLLADSSIVIRGEFRKNSPEPALILDERYAATEAELRRAVARAAMTAGRESFATHLRRGVEDVSRRLVLSAAARAAGHFDDPEIEARYRKDLDTALIDAYLQDAVSSQIVFKREEFQQYYDEHVDDFRGPTRVQLATLVVEDEAVAREMSTRLRAGADFDFIKEQYIGPDSEGKQSEPAWAMETSFSDAIRAQLDALKVGESSEAVLVGHGWLVFKLIGRKPGATQPMEEVESLIRQVVFRREFDEKLADLLRLLKERSEITLNEAAIAAYFNPGS